MALRHRTSSRTRLGGVALGTSLLLGCGGPETGREAAGGQEATSGTQAVGQAGAAAAGAADRIARADFVLCPAIEPIGAELAGMAGFRMDPARGVESVAGECFVRGDGFLMVALAPAFTPSLAMHASGYEGEQAPLPQLGAQAVVIDAPQPHVIFELLGQIVDVGVEAPGVGAETAVAVAERVRAALMAANPPR